MKEDRIQEKANPKLLQIRDLNVCFKTDSGIVRAVDGVSLSVERGKVLGIVGESGSGKSISSLAVMQLIPKPNGYAESGEILFEGEDILKMGEKDIRRIRGNKIAMIFQEPMSSLNPVYKIGFQLGETLKLHKGIKGEENRKRCVEALELVRVADPEKMIYQYPHQLSGGMRQRVMIAMAMLCDPKLLIADEPTTALDVTIQAQILELIRSVKEQHSTAVMFITHDLGVIAEIADTVAVMYAGRIVEEAEVEQLLRSPVHPYTQGLIQAIPENFSVEKGFYTIPGMIASGVNRPTGCSFAPRCVKRMEICDRTVPPLTEVSPGHRCRCFLNQGEGGGKDE